MVDTPLTVHPVPFPPNPEMSARTELVAWERQRTAKAQEQLTLDFESVFMVTCGVVVDVGLGAVRDNMSDFHFEIRPALK